jgi:hypothetical protein
MEEIPRSAPTTRRSQLLHDSVRGVLIAACGLVALLTPLLLWLAWSPWGFSLIVAGSGAALLVIYALIWSSAEPW